MWNKYSRHGYTNVYKYSRTRDDEQHYIQSNYLLGEFYFPSGEINLRRRIQAPPSFITIES